MLQKPNIASNTFIFSFMIFLCCACAIILSTLSSALKDKQKEAMILDRSKQMLIAAKIFHNDGYFLLPQSSATNHYVPAIFDFKSKTLIATPSAKKAPPSAILKVFEKRLKPILIKNNGERTSFEKEEIDYQNYLEENHKKGFAHLDLKLAYAILPQEDSPSKEIMGYVIPINGFGLWGPIYGYLAVYPNGNHVMGISWYEHAETPGLGANITETWWQDQFLGKKIFLENTDGTTQAKTAPMGIEIVRGKVSDVYGNDPRSKSSVDGISGATLTGNGLTKAYKESLSPYRDFLLRLQKNMHH